MKKLKIIITILFTVIYLFSAWGVLALETLPDTTGNSNQPSQDAGTTSTPEAEPQEPQLPAEPNIPDIAVVDILPENTDVIVDQGVVLQTSNDVPPIQDTFNTQEGSETEILTTDENAEIVLVEETTGGDEIVSEENITDEVVPEDEGEIVISDEKPTVLLRQRITIRELKPKAIYKFSLTQKTIKAKKITENTDKDTLLKSALIDNVIDPVIDNNEGTMSFSGACNAKYFVVLLYKNENDYTDNSNSYIINKAFDCVGGNFSYTIDQLPNNLPNGNYYLLIGQQEEIGSWTPISSLTEIVINKNLPVFEEVVENEEIIIPQETPTPETNPAANPIDEVQ